MIMFVMILFPNSPHVCSKVHISNYRTIISPLQPIGDCLFGEVNNNNSEFVSFCDSKNEHFFFTCTQLNHLSFQWKYTLLCEIPTDYFCMRS